MAMIFTKRFYVVDFISLVFYSGMIILSGCAKNEKFLKQNHADLVNLKYDVAELGKKYKVLERSVKGLSDRSRSVGVHLDRNKVKLLSKKEMGRGNKVSSNTIKINALELDISQIKSYLSAKTEKTELLKKRLNSLAKKVTRLPKKQEYSAKTPETVKSGNQKELYEDSMTLMDLEKYSESIESFREFGRSFPNSSLADNAQYWIGECYYALKEFAKSVEEFQKVLDGAFRDKNKAPDAMLKKGFAYIELKKKEEAVSTLKKLIGTYGENHNFQYIVGRARAKITNLQATMP